MKARRWMHVWLLLILVLPSLAWTSQPSTERLAEREAFRQGWQAAARGDQAGVISAMSRLPDYPLLPYLEFELLRQRLDQVPEPVMEQFLARHRGWSFESSLETAWFRSLGKRGEWGTLLRLASAHGDTEVRCHVARARIELGRTEGLQSEVERLWLVGRSQPRACDPVFAWWRRQGNPSLEAAWRRFGLAMDAGETGLARYLRRYLASDYRQWADYWLRMSARPHQTLREARNWPDHEVARQLVDFGLRRQVRQDWARAESHWRVLRPRLSWADEHAGRLDRELALFRAVALDEGAIAAIDALSDRFVDQQMLEWRARVAMAHGDWTAVLESIQAMGVTEQAGARWRYWRGRALAELGRPEAAVVFASLSTEATYHGFMAAARLGQELSLCEEPLPVNASVQQRLIRDAEFERALELFHVGLQHHARVTWNSVSRRLSRGELEQAALLASAEGWHDRAIAALNQSGSRQAYPWRFPMAEKGRVLDLAERHGVDPALVFGLMRAESAMQSDAVSPAGARGLLQLMPTTAQAVASRNGLAYRGPSDLTKPEINVALGIAHLAELQRRYEGDWTRVAAAYNAGINAVARWLNDRPVTAADVWMETLPFFETRDYVPRVLAFATIYEWQLDRDPQVLITHALERDSDGRFACSN